jgi:hypothetical protein
VPIAIEINPVRILKSSFVEIHLNIIIKFTTVPNDHFLPIFQLKFCAIVLLRSFKLLTTKFNALLCVFMMQ